MKKLLYFLCLIITLVSCSDSSKDPYSIDFGKVKYRDIFDGHKGCDFFRNHLEYFPFRWTKSDTVVSTKNIEIQFNKDCVRSGTEVELLIADKNQKINDGLDVMIDGVDCANRTFNVSATDTLQELSISLRVNPSLGDTVLSGHIFASSDNLEIANEVNMNGISPISQWTVRQVIKLNWWYWIIWLLFLLILLFLTFLIVMLIIEFWDFIIGLIIVIGDFIRNTIKKSKDKVNKNKRKKKINEKKIWLQTVESNNLLKGFKISEPEYVDENNLNDYIWWYESERAKAERFAKKLTKFVKSEYDLNDRSINCKYIWLSVYPTSHVKKIVLVENTYANVDDLEYCLYYPNTRAGRKHAESMMRKINDFMIHEWRK